MHGGYRDEANDGTVGGAGAGVDGGAGGGGGGVPGGAGGNGAPFLDLVPAEYRESVTKAGIGDVQALVKNWMDSQSMVGASVRIPGKDAGESDIAKFEDRLRTAVPDLVRLPKAGDTEGWAKYYEKLGKPGDASGYKFDPVEGIAPETAADMSKFIATMAHKHNLLPDQARGVYADVVESMKASGAAATQAADAASAALKLEWGSLYDVKMAGAQNVLKKFGGDEGMALAMAELDSTGLGNVPALAKILARVNEAMGEDGIIVGDVKGRGNAMTLSEVNARIAEIRDNTKHPFHDPMSAGHKQAMIDMESLYTQRSALQGR
jgi:hypothetical protein